MHNWVLQSRNYKLQSRKRGDIWKQRVTCERWKPRVSVPLWLLFKKCSGECLGNLYIFRNSKSNQVRPSIQVADFLWAEVIFIMWESGFEKLVQTKELDELLYFPAWRKKWKYHSVWDKLFWFHNRTFLSISPLTLAISGPCPGWSWPPAACRTPPCLQSPPASCSATWWTSPPRSTISSPLHPPSRWTAPNYRKWKLLPACGTSGLPPPHWWKQFDL